MWPAVRIDATFLGSAFITLSVISTVRRNYEGSYFEKEPYQSELHNYAEDQGNKIRRPSFPTYAPLRQFSKDRRDRNVGLDQRVQQINVPNDLQPQECEGRPQRKKVDESLHNVPP
jgi:hypothetical protein